jgi:hypothetical protein
MLDLSGARALLAQAQARWRGRKSAPVAEHLVRLRQRKEQVANVLDQRRQAARFEAGPDRPADSLEGISEAGAAPPPPPPGAPPADAPPAKASEELSYTERLLAAKRKAQKP